MTFNNRNNIYSFLAKNAVFLLANSFVNPYPASYKTVGILNSIDIIEFMDLMVKNKDYFNLGFSHGRKYLTTNYGLFLTIGADPTIVQTIKKDHAYTVFSNAMHVDVTLLYPEDTLQIILNNIIPPLTHYKQYFLETNKEEIKAQIQENIERKEKEQITEKRYLEKSKEFSDYILAKAPYTGVNLCIRLWDFNLFYDMADDSNVYRSGVIQEQRLKDELTTLGMDADLVFKMLREARSK